MFLKGFLYFACDPRGKNYNRGLGKPRPYLKFRPLDCDFLSHMDTHDRFSYMYYLICLFAKFLTAIRSVMIYTKAGLFICCSMSE